MRDATIWIDPTQQTARVSPLIYGHFIEHLGRCITGGIWGEMLRSRRFAGFDDDHNGIADPWVKVGGRAPHLLLEPPENTSGGHLTMRCLRDTGLRHRVAHPGLAVRRGEEYSVSLQMRATGEIANVQISLAGDSTTLAHPGPEFREVEWTARARWDSDDAALTIGCRGEGELHVHAPSVMRARDREIGGFRADVVELVRAITPPIIRWPGGCFADGYRWRDGIGKRTHREARFDPAWGAWDDNDFGSEEFVAFCRLVGAEPYICVNTGSADAAAAAHWVRWCRERDLGVRWWGIGNETYGSWEIGNVPADEYARLFLRFAEAMRAEAPGIELVAVGADPVEYPDWNRTVLEIAGEQIDHLSVHRYVPHTRDDEDRERQYRAIVASPIDIERRLEMVADTIEEALGEDSDVGIAFDEWNVWLDATGDDGIEERYEVRDALFAAGVFNAMQRVGDRLSMANLAQLVNVLPAIRTSRTAAWGTPIYHAFDLYRRCGPRVIACECSSPTFGADAFGNIPALDKVPWLDATATALEDGGQIMLAVINRHPTEAIEASIEIEGASEPSVTEIAVLSGQSERAVTAENRPDGVSVTAMSPGAESSPQNHRFPPHSATIITLLSG